MFQAEADIASNLLKARHAGRVTALETKRGADEMDQLVKRLQPGFRLLTDMSELEAMELECVPHIKQMMDSCNRQGVALVVRVIPDPHKDIGMNIMSLFHYDRGVRFVTCATMQEAEQVLKE